MRNLEWIYALPSNTPEQDEADRGSVLAIRTTRILGELLQSKRRRRVLEAATMENPRAVSRKQKALCGPSWRSTSSWKSSSV